VTKVKTVREYTDMTVLWKVCTYQPLQTTFSLSHCVLMSSEVNLY